ncbi:hypothetical protein E6C27_scaffold90G00700 [Cucumis melo var. makuwa]|uniref:DUF4218 domain-containing protein n=1 Tax=Cucumis melo var. makuwa TaxID=1194695 RepID=A0A5A7VEJ7_CUCMM|nr:hypothetical protein E6C27_scaffold90G00700 [Cucumis melo var. makuwa]
MSLLIPGPRSPGSEIDVYLQPLIEELKVYLQLFQLHAALLWTINDFSMFGDLSGWSTKGHHACPICIGDKSSFEIRGKTKYTKNAQLDLQDLKIRKDLHLIEIGIRLVKPHLSYTLTSSKRVEFCKFLKSVKFPNGLVSNISRYVNEREGKIPEAYLMNESSTFCSRYLSGIEARFTRDKRNDDTILEDEVIGEFEFFKQKVRPLGASSLRTLSEEEKCLFHWYILNNVEEILEYRK